MAYLDFSQIFIKQSSYTQFGKRTALAAKYLAKGIVIGEKYYFLISDLTKEKLYRMVQQIRSRVPTISPSTNSHSLPRDLLEGFCLLPVPNQNNY